MWGKIKLLLLVSVAAISGCATNYKGEGSRALPADQLAIVEHHNPAYSSFIVSHVDGKYRGVGIFKEYYFVPGTHSMRLTGAVAVGEKRYPRPEQSLVSAHPLELTFLAEPGKRYVIDVSFDTGTSKWGAYITDKSTGKIVSTAKEITGN